MNTLQTILELLKAGDVGMWAFTVLLFLAGMALGSAVGVIIAGLMRAASMATPAIEPPKWKTLAGVNGMVKPASTEANTDNVKG